MCKSCQSWQLMAERAWEEVFRLIDIANALCPRLPLEARYHIQKMLDIIKVDPTAIERRIRELAARCEAELSGVEKANLRHARSEILEGAAQRMDHLKRSIVGPSLQYLEITQQLEGMSRYLGMMNSVMQEWADALRSQQESWDAMWARHQARQQQIDQMKLDALAGTPFIKAYLLS
jgi:hypothetical protein